MAQTLDRTAAAALPRAAPGASGLSLRRVSYRYGSAERGVHAVDGLNLDIEPGEFVCLLGPSGCGKSTLLRLVAGLLRPSDGEIVLRRTGRAELAGRSALPRQPSAVGRLPLFPRLLSRLSGDEPRRDASEIGWMAQRDGLLPWLTTAANVALPLRVLGRPDEEAQHRAAEALRLVGLAAFDRHYPHQLSGGMRQRAALARAVVHQPGLLLLDEPFAHLDELTRDELGDALVQLWEQRRPTVVMVTHSALEAVRLADRVVVLSPRPARVTGAVLPDAPRPRADGQPATLAALRQARELLRDGASGGQRDHD